MAGKTGHKNRRMPDGSTIVEWLKPTVKDEARFYGIEMPSDEQIAIVLRSARMHHLMTHAAGYDQSELHSPGEITKYWPIESSIGRFLRDAPLETLDAITQCPGCYCMTKTINGKCGKCGHEKDNHSI